MCNAGESAAKRTAAAKTNRSRSVPSAAVAAGYFRNLLGLLQTDPIRGREVLSRFVAPIVMTPKAEGPDRGYRATGAFNMSFFLSAGTAAPAGSGKSSCAGAMGALFTAVSLGFERRIAA